MYLNTEIVDWWWSERRLIVHFCWFSRPLVYGKDPMNPSRSLSDKVQFLVKIRIFGKMSKKSKMATKQVFFGILKEMKSLVLSRNRPK